MKKIFLSVLAVAALASCTKMDTAYEAPQEIGFTAVAGNITKAPVDGETYPEDLNMFIFAQTAEITDGSSNYINNGEFKYKKVNGSIKLWGGYPNPYYWPNVHKLNFAGYSKSGNVATDATGATVSYSFADDSGLSITGYTPSGSDNDLMWFGNTKKTTNGASGYGKETPYVPVEMYHTCSWITFRIKGEAGTINSTIQYMKITGIDNYANVLCYNVPQSGKSIVWSKNEDGKTSENIISLTSNLTLSETAINVETGKSTDVGGNIVLIPQLPGNISITYQGTNASVAPETVSASLSLDFDESGKQLAATTAWEPGKHYIYTITIKANEILVSPTPVDWGDVNSGVTVE